MGLCRRFLERVKALGNNRGPHRSVLALQEEMGEYATALTVEEGNKERKLKESSLEESVDVVICALDLFYSSGGTVDMLVAYGDEKLDKWERRNAEEEKGMPDPYWEPVAHSKAMRVKNAKD